MTQLQTDTICYLGNWAFQSTKRVKYFLENVSHNVTFKKNLSGKLRVRDIVKTVPG